MVILQRFRSYIFFLCCRCLIVVFGLSSACYDVVFFVLSSSYWDVRFVLVILQHLICRRLVMMWYFSSYCCDALFCEAIRTNKAYSIDQRYQIMVISVLKNWSRIYYSHYIIKFVSFMPIHYTINLYIVSLCMVFSKLYFGSIDLLQVLINNIIFPLKKKRKSPSSTHAFSISHVEGATYISLSRGTNLLHPLMSLHVIYYMSNYSMYYYSITNDVKLCQNIELLM